MITKHYGKIILTKKNSNDLYNIIIFEDNNPQVVMDQVNAYLLSISDEIESLNKAINCGIYKKDDNVKYYELVNSTWNVTLK